MKIRVSPAVFDGTINIPGSKSHAQRLIAVASLSKGMSLLKNVSYCNDVLASVRMAEALGAVVEKTDNGLSVKGQVNTPDEKAFCFESGLCLRMFTPISSVLTNRITLYAEGSLQKRNIGGFAEPMEELGVKITTNNGFPPVQTNGFLRGGQCCIDASDTSQFLTGLLIALPLAKEDSVIKVSSLVSKPYVDLTLDVIKAFKVEISKTDDSGFNIKAGQEYTAGTFYVEGDWSSAANIMVAAAIAGNVKIKGLNINSFQSDKDILAVLDAVGAAVRVSDNEIKVKRRKLRAFQYNAVNAPDLVPVLVSLAVNCKGKSRIGGVSRLQNKESNRVLSIIEEFGRMGISVNVEGDYFIVEGQPIAGGCELSSQNDHRIAMALAVLALNAKKPVIITGAEAVNKSFPGFWEWMSCFAENIEILES